MKDTEEFNVGRVAELVGVTPQTIRNYVRRGLLTAGVDERNGYRRFTTETVNRAGAIRFCSNIGMTLSMTEKVLSNISHEDYVELLEKTERLLETRIAHDRMVLEYVKSHKNTAACLQDRLNQCTVVENMRGYFCLDYQRGESIILNSKRERLLMGKWYEQAPFTGNYSPYPLKSLQTGRVDELVLGVAAREDYVKKLALPTEAPVYRRPGGRHVKVLIHHAFDLTIFPDGPGFLWDFLKANRLQITGEPFVVSEGTYFDGGEPYFYSYLFLPVA